VQSKVLALREISNLIYCISSCERKRFCCQTTVFSWVGGKNREILFLRQLSCQIFLSKPP